MKLTHGSLIVEDTKGHIQDMIFTPRVSSGCNSFGIFCLCLSVCESVRPSVSL